MEGASRNDDILPLRKNIAGSVEEYEQLLQIWRDDLERLAQEFIDGGHAVAPKHRDKTCDLCGLQSLCRVNELKLATAEAGDAHE